MSRSGHKLTSFVIILAIIVVEIATDIYIPTLSYLSQLFQTSEEAVNSSLSASLLGFSLAGPIFGPLSDAYGRKKLILFGLLVFALASFACSYASNVESLIFWRFVQGLGSAGPAVLGWAILKDLYDGREAAHAMTNVGMAMTLSPAIAPLIGGYIASHFDWGWIFVVVGAAGGLSLILSLKFLPETLANEDRIPFSIQGQIKTYTQILKDRKYLLPSLISSVTYGCLWSYLSATTFFFVKRLEFSMIQYAYFDAVLLVFYVLGSLYTQKLLKTQNIQLVLNKGIILCIFGGISLLFVSVIFPMNAFAITAVMTIHSFGMALVFPNAATLALDSTPDNLGSGSALLSTLQSLISGLMIIISGYLYVNNIIWVAVMILTAAMLAMWLNRRALSV